ncbi:kinesin-like protein KIN-12E isoform X2 [Aristolochia californica]|uniref:kinesin-like protein KIN-12E isoform X2 n=1 Tax=Aristolochia californica TaxID=171875 RepID=UPI0035E05273
MSGQISSLRFLKKKSSRNTQSEGNENEFNDPVNAVPCSLPRTPLNTIQDPLLSPREFPGSEPNSAIKLGGYLEKKSEATDVGTQVLDLRGDGGGGSEYGTPRGVPGPRGGVVCKVARGGAGATHCPSVEVPHFELDEDSSFWMDHNVQVLIRIRPVSSSERASQGYIQCLRQESARTLTWLGPPETRFTFDHIACETISQEKLFRVAGVPMVDNCMSGYNSCMFAYGQTGSGKTYTMMGEINEIKDQFNNDCGITPRIFQYLFTRIRLEEEKRREEKLKYSCKCSFLEIYNEQITDLLEPSSTNLQLREDLKKGVHVENLKEFEVTTVQEVVKLLLQGAANRKMAATCMNSESSRSHSVFTCVIESQWEKDSMMHFRFGRLNLVDLAGSERQKSSGAEGERLKEAANINKSLSTLGLVIMTLVDVAHGRHRHVPYRDSRLTFLLQDSLGGNSKTTIIANISPSICSASETLSTLKFAQRAKLIQNNAKVNEDASGDVMALQRQIQQLKDEVKFLLTHQNTVNPRSLDVPSCDPSGDICEARESSQVGAVLNAKNCKSGVYKKMKCLEATLFGALRREKMAETVVKKLEAEIEHLNRLVRQREEDAQRNKMMLRFQEAKLRRQELIQDGFLSADEYIMEENTVLSEEIELLKSRLDKNPELTQFALENVRLLEQLRMFQDFYQQGEREALLAEVSDLRNQLLEVFKGNYQQSESPSTPSQREQEASQCLSSNVQSKNLLHSEVDSIWRDLEACRKKLRDCMATNARLTRETDHLRYQMKEYAVYSGSAGYLSENVVRPKERSEECDDNQFPHQLESHHELSNVEKVCEEVDEEMANRIVFLQGELSTLQQEAETMTASESSATKQFLLLRTENQQLKEMLYAIEQENIRLENALAARDSDINALSKEWEKATLDLTNFLSDGSKSLENAFDQVDSIVTSFAQQNFLIGEQAETAVKVFLEKEKLIGHLQKRLEETQNLVVEMEEKLSTLKGATLAITEVHELENTENLNEIIQLRKMLNEKISEIGELESRLSDKDEHIIRAEKCASAALISIKRLCQMNCAVPTCTRLFESQENEFCCNHQGIEEQIFDCDPHLLAEEKLRQANHLLVKFEEAQETMKEADVMLNALLKVNEDVKQEAEGWKQTSEVLRTERLALVKENEQLEASIILNEEQYLSYQEQINADLTDVMESISSLQTYFLQTQRSFSDEFEVMYADILSFMQELRNCARTARSVLEDIWSNIMESSFVSFVSYQCHLQTLHEKLLHIHVDTCFPASFRSFSETDNVNYKSLGLLQEFRSSVDQVANLENNKLNLELDSQSIKEANAYHPTYLRQSSIDVPVDVILGPLFQDKDSLSPDTSPSRISRELGLLSCKIENHISSKKEMGSAVSISENLSLQRELARKNVLLEGLLFDLRLLQESTSETRDIREEAEMTVASLNQVQRDLDIKTNLLDHTLVQLSELKSHLSESQAALSISKSELKQANEAIEVLLSENADLRGRLDDMNTKKTYTQEQLEEKQKVIEGLEREVLEMGTSAKERILTSVEDIENELRTVRNERDQLHVEVASLSDKLEMSNALADENEAIAIEARQLSDASNVYAEQKEEEVKILEHSVEELEFTINVLEKKVYEMGREVEQNRILREAMEVEVQALRHRLLAVNKETKNLNQEYSSTEDRREHALFRQLDDRIMELCEAKRRVMVLEKERANQAKEIKQCKEYISELVLHAEAQASQYQEKYKMLEAMVHEVKTDTVTTKTTSSAVNKTDRSSIRTRGSSSPFRCIAGLVQQMNTEKDQELSIARLRVEELEDLTVSLQREVCMLRARLAAAESMAHDVIRDLLGVKLDISNYVTLVDQQQILKLAEKVQLQMEELSSKDQEILGLRKHVDGFNQERKSLFDDINHQEAHILHSQVMFEQLQQRDQLLTAQNEMLKMDKSNLKRKLGELEVIIENLLGSQSNRQVHQPMKTKENDLLGIGNEQFRKRLAHSEKLLSRVNSELAHYCKSKDKDPCIDLN